MKINRIFKLFVNKLARYKCKSNGNYPCYFFYSTWMLILIPFSGIAQSNKENSFHFIVEPYIQQVTDTSFYVLFETSLPARGIVKLGIAEFNVLKPNLNRIFNEKEITEYHNILVQGLNTDEYYFYQALTISDSGDTLYGPVTPLHIPDFSRMPVSFAVIGDTQNSPLIWARLSDLIYQERPCFIIHVGDLVQYGPNKNDWVDEFFKPAKNLLRFCPIYPAIGNHEMDHYWFYRYFNLPSPEWFYTLKKGNVFFVIINTNRDVLPGSSQYRELEHILASVSEKWKIVVHHHPVYVSEEGFYGNTWFQRNVHGDPNVMHLKKLYETYGVDLVLNGHAHFYERTWPLMSDKVNMKEGVTYITTGGGNSEYSNHAANKAWYDARTRVVNHFIYISATDHTLYVRAIDTTGNMFDYWTIEKGDKDVLNAPLIYGDNQYFINTTKAYLKNLNSSGEIIYSLDGKKYLKGKSGTGSEIIINISETATISGLIQDKNIKSRIAEKTFEKLPVFPALKSSIGESKIKAEYYEGNWISLPDFSRETILRHFILDSLTLTDIKPRNNEHFAVRFTGYFSVPVTDIYRFLLESFDGSRLIVDGNTIINNDGIHYEIKREKFVALEKGLHSFEVQYFKYVRRATLRLWLAKQNEPMINFNEFIFKNESN